MSTSATSLDVTTESASPGRTVGQRLRVTGMVAVGVLSILLVGHNLTSSPKSSRASHRMPQNGAMEDQLGIRVGRVPVGRDGGLITLPYVVLDREKATRFQSDTAHP